MFLLIFDLRMRSQCSLNSWNDLAVLTSMHSYLPYFVGLNAPRKVASQQQQIKLQQQNINNKIRKRNGTKNFLIFSFNIICCFAHFRIYAYFTPLPNTAIAAQLSGSSEQISALFLHSLAL